MRTEPLKICCVLCMFLTACAPCAVAQDQPPVNIVFDKDSERIDIVTGEKLPNYTLAERGSFLFYNDRLDNPSNSFWYFFDGRRTQSQDDMVFIRHIKAFGTWVVFNKRERNNVLTGHPRWHCEIGHHAVSFIPVNAKSGKSEKRVFVLLDDINMIQWEEYDYWLATESQEEIESKEGIIY